MKKKEETKIINVNVSGRTLFPNGTEELILEAVRPAKGFGRWIFCIDCGKNTQPLLSGINQIICSECGYKLTPDFFSLRNLKRWLSGDTSALEEDLHSEEAKNWKRSWDEGKKKAWKITRMRKRK